MAKEILWIYMDRSICALIPKKRGVGYLRQPYGHHINSEMEKFRDDLNGVDIYGLDGHLQIMVDKAEYEDKDLVFGKAVIERLASYHSLPFRHVSLNEFWLNHPV
ncbi:hypothetical protein [Alteromonas gracilis]|uniref:hypothetical protein n=1 Tax=Alteromonas gracilis TaxID=1479524 RepID=UPI003735E426